MRLSVWIAAAALTSTLAAQSAAPSPADLAARVQAHYASVKDFTADFTLRQTSALRPKPTEDQGHLKVKKPLKMRWTFTTNDKNEFIADGVKLYLVMNRDKYVEVSTLPRESESGSGLLFLAGRGNLTRDFTPSMPPDQPAGEWRLILKPSTKRVTDLQLLTLDVDRTTLQWRGMTIVDNQGVTSAYRFSNLRENRNLADKEFVFTKPRGFALRYQ
jgi:outer membrane lipoprotein carrier protein